MIKMRTSFLALVLGSILVAPILADEPHAFPVPFAPAKNPSQTAISFTNLPGSGTVKVYTVDGQLVTNLDIPPGGLLDWPVTNTKGQKVATGVYIYFIDGPGVQKEGKLVVIR